MPNKVSPIREANRLSKLLSAAFGADRFPVDVRDLALSYAEQFSLQDPITEVISADISGFEGALIPDEQREKWAILYSSRISSPGRVRFTLGHEFGHYVLHRNQREKFECTEDDLLGASSENQQLEAEADTFASYLLMPLDDFRHQIAHVDVDLDVLGKCAERYGVSLIAMIRKWLEMTDQPAIFAMSRDGFVTWATSSHAAFKNGYFLPSRKKIIEVPGGSLAANAGIQHERKGRPIPANLWFNRAPRDMSLQEMKISADNYDQIMTLMILPRAAPRFSDTAEFEGDSYDHFSGFSRS